MLHDIGPIPIKDRASIAYVEKGRLDVKDGAFVVVDKNGVRTHIPVGGLACLMLEPGARVSHAAVALASKVGCLLVWIGEAGVRLYATGQPGGARADRLLRQAQLALDERTRLQVVRNMYAYRFDEPAPSRRSIDQLRGIEGARVREMYKVLAQRHGVAWHGRRYDPSDWASADIPNRCLSAANAALYGVTEAAVLAAGYAPAIGFIHSGKPLSFVYDIADLFKFETVVPVAFKIAASSPREPERAVRLACRESFRETRILEKIIPTIDEVLAVEDNEDPDHQGVVGPAFEEGESLGDAGHRG